MPLIKIIYLQQKMKKVTLRLNKLGHVQPVQSVTQIYGKLKAFLNMMKYPNFLGEQPPNGNIDTTPTQTVVSTPTTSISRPKVVTIQNAFFSGPNASDALLASVNNIPSDNINIINLHVNTAS